MRALVLVSLVIITYGCTAKEESKPVTPDTTSPTVVSTFPADGDTNVNLPTELTCTFSEEMDCLSIDSSSFYLVRGLIRVPASTSCQSNIATLSPAKPLLHGQIYGIYISPLVRDLAGNHMDSAYSCTFTTTEGPSIVSTYPLNGDTGIDLHDTIMVIFAADMDCSTFDLSTFNLDDGLAGSVECLGDTVFFLPEDMLSHNHTYTAKVLHTVTDTAGNEMKNDYLWSFNTTGGPYVLETDPHDGAWGVSTAASISVTFSDDIDAATVTPATFYLSDAVSGEVTYDNRTATFVPDDTLFMSTNYTATIKDEITDVDGNPLESDYSWSFEVRGVMMPLSIGNRWIHHIERWDTLGNQLADYYDTTIIIDDTIIDDVLWYVDNHDNLYINRPDGLWNFGKSNNQFLQAKYPSEVGETYNIPFNDVTPVVGTFKVASIDAHVTVEAGSFNCCEYSSLPIDPRIMYYMYYAPDIGLIEVNVFEEKQFGHVLVRQHTLVDYRIQ